MAKKVFIVASAPLYQKMFEENGWKVVLDILDADLVQFTGGPDIDPSFYNEKPHNTTHSTINRDMQERLVFNVARRRKLPMTGICRGGQFLNVMCGGQLWQDVDGHASTKGHMVKDLYSFEVFHVTSTHHQMMIPNYDSGIVIVSADTATWKERQGPNCSIRYRKVLTTFDPDPEVVWYSKQRCFCFQPHPEYSGNLRLRERYFQYLEDYIFATEE